MPIEPSVAADADARRLPFQIRGCMQTLLVLRLLAPQAPDLLERLREKVAYAPDFYRDAPILLDLAPLSGKEPGDLAALVEALGGLRLRVVGVQNADERWREAARRAGLAVFAAGQERPAPPTAGQPAARGSRGAAMVVDRPVRGGQQIVAPEGDLVVTAPVGHGAEIAAVGHIHVYAPLRGRAFAGIEGDEGAMIFCDRFEAELVAVAGTYLVAEELDPRLRGRRVRVRHDGRRIVVEPVDG
ncbi:Septum site-determining protein MinC [bacterium HR40]|nr:Septum site-determining protein MinC [bacterium HR40]